MVKSGVVGKVIKPENRIGMFQQENTVVRRERALDGFMSNIKMVWGISQQNIRS